MEASLAKTNDEQMLIDRAKRGDVDAFETLYRSTAPRVFGLCLRMTADRQLATELLQDVFVRIWEALPSFRGEAAFASWAHRLTVNLVLEQTRRESRRAAHTDNDGEVAGAVAAPASDQQADARMDLERAMTILTPGQRRVFVLHDVAGYSHIEIAEMTGLATGTLRAQLHLARKSLMKALER
jgi:RNA polymerase sigma factor (sigma-70 family)